MAQQQNGQSLPAGGLVKRLISVFDGGGVLESGTQIIEHCPVPAPGDSGDGGEAGLQGNSIHSGYV